MPDWTGAEYGVVFALYVLFTMFYLFALDGMYHLYKRDKKMADNRGHYHFTKGLIFKYSFGFYLLVNIMVGVPEENALVFALLVIVNVIFWHILLWGYGKIRYPSIQKYMRENYR